MLIRLVVNDLNPAMNDDIDRGFIGDMGGGKRPFAPAISGTPLELWVITTIPCTWLGITTHSSNSISCRMTDDCFHADATINP